MTRTVTVAGVLYVAPPPTRGGNRSVAHSAVVRVIVDYLLVRKAWVLKVHGGAYQRPGVPDILACLRPQAQQVVSGDGWGVLLAIEVKTGRAVLSRAQEEERTRVDQAGGYFILAHSVDDVEAALVRSGYWQPLLNIGKVST